MRPLVVAIGIALVPCRAPAASQDVVAVFDMNVQNAPGVTRAQASKFTDLLDSVVTASGYRTVPRSEIQARLVEQQSDSYRACYDDACQIEIGKSVAAQKALSATWARCWRSACLVIHRRDRSALRQNSASLSGSAKREIRSIRS